MTGRGGKGRELLQRGRFTRIVRRVPELPDPLAAEGLGLGRGAELECSAAN